MRLSISNIAWSPEFNHEMYQYIHEHGFTGLEIAPTLFLNNDNPYSLLDEARLLSKEIKRKYNLDISSMQSILFGKTEKLFGSTNERTEIHNYIKKAIVFANTIGCKNLVFGSPKNRNMHDSSEYHIAVSFFKTLGSFAKENNTTISIEANPKVYGTNFINTTKEAIQLVKDVNEDNFMINLDIGTIIENGENISDIKNNMHYINHIHISEPNLVKIQSRKIHTELVQMLIQYRYNKYVSIEMKNTNDINDTKSAIKYIKGVFNAS